ncbi:MAG: hypothetical protein LBF54_04605 [Holosporaceae bacterium]|nr:hypothetical protein [Holosporaceae bacterium]
METVSQDPNALEITRAARPSFVALDTGQASSGDFEAIRDAGSAGAQQFDKDAAALESF